MTRICQCPARKTEPYTGQRFILPQAGRPILFSHHVAYQKTGMLQNGEHQAVVAGHDVKTLTQ